MPGAGAGDNGSFRIEGKRLVTAAAFDFETDATLSIRVRATDLEGSTYAKSLTVSVIDVAENEAPVAVDDTRTTAEDTALVLPVTGAGSPSANDTDADGDPLTVTAVAAAVGGTAAITAGAIRFTPTADLCGVGAGRFDYTVADGHGGTDVGRVTVDITCVPDDPDRCRRHRERRRGLRGRRGRGAGERQRRRRRPAGHRRGEPAGRRHGADHGWRHGPHLRAGPGLLHGATPDTFTYSLTPGGSTATVSVTVTCVDDPPTAVDDTATVAEDSGATAIDVLGNDLDADGGPITIDSVDQPTNGEVVITSGGTGLTYEPDPNFCSATADTFDYTLAPGVARRHGLGHRDVRRRPTDGGGRHEVGGPGHGGRRRSTSWATTSTPTAGRWSIESTTQPVHGDVVITGGGTGLTYDPDDGFCGYDAGHVHLHPQRR